MLAAGTQRGLTQRENQGRLPGGGERAQVLKDGAGVCEGQGWQRRVFWAREKSNLPALGLLSKIYTLAYKHY